VSGGPTVIAFAAPSGTGKTSLITRLLAELKGRGLRVGAIKSDAHRVELDTPGKDTHRMRESGAEVTGLVSRDQVAIFRDAPGEDMTIRRIVEVFFSELDLVLAEGFRSQGYPTLVVSRSGIDMSGWEWPGNVIAVVSDREHEELPRFALDDVAGIADFLCRKLAERPARALGEAR
jgi:molybdopterin-guanine dinucleotide biosynthesis protein B